MKPNSVKHFKGKTKCSLQWSKSYSVNLPLLPLRLPPRLPPLLPPLFPPLLPPLLPPLFPPLFPPLGFGFGATPLDPIEKFEHIFLLPDEMMSNFHQIKNKIKKILPFFSLMTSFVIIFI